MKLSTSLVLSFALSTSLYVVGCTSKAEQAAPAAESAAAPVAETKKEETAVSAPTSEPAAQAPVTTDALAASLANVYFEYDSSVLTEKSKQQLDNIAAALKAQPSTKIVVEGHTDSRGSEEYNLALSERRAQAISEYLSAAGVSSSQLVAEPKGENFPVAQGEDESAYSQNRRGEFKKF
jgi:peptidoglycan-associated lipoprotein